MTQFCTCFFCFWPSWCSRCHPIWHPSCSSPTSSHPLLGQFHSRPKAQRGWLVPGSQGYNTPRKSRSRMNRWFECRLRWVQCGQTQFSRRSRPQEALGSFWTLEQLLQKGCIGICWHCRRRGKTLHSWDRIWWRTCWHRRANRRCSHNCHRHSLTVVVRSRRPTYLKNTKYLAHLRLFFRRKSVQQSKGFFIPNNWQVQAWKNLPKMPKWYPLCMYSFFFKTASTKSWWQNPVFPFFSKKHLRRTLLVPLERLEKRTTTFSMKAARRGKLRQYHWPIWSIFSTK